jgi:hypothetical protein
VSDASGTIVVPEKTAAQRSEALARANEVQCQLLGRNGGPLRVAPKAASICHPICPPRKKQRAIARLRSLEPFAQRILAFPLVP